MGRRGPSFELVCLLALVLMFLNHDVNIANHLSGII